MRTQRHHAVGKKAVAGGGRPRRDAHQLEGHDGGTEERHDAAHRAHEEAGAFAPPHHFREREVAHDTRHDLREDLRRGTPGDGAAGCDDRAARRVHDDQVRDGHLLLAGEAFGRARGLALGVVRGGQRGAEDFLKLVLLAFRQLPENHRETARGGVRLGRRRGETLLGQRGFQPASQIHPSDAERGSRDLLRPDLEKKVLAAHTAAAGSGSGAGRPAASRRATNARAQAQARSRTRRINPTRSVAETAPRASRTLNWCEHASAAS